MNYQMTPQGWVAPLQAMQMQQQAQVNNQQSALVESCQRVDRAKEQVLSAQEIQDIRRNLAQSPFPSLPTDITPIIPLPDSLPVSVRNFIAAVARKLGVSDRMVFGSVLGAAFCAARGAFSVKISEDYQELLTGYVLIAAESGQRKSAVSDLLRQPFKDWEAEAQRHMANQNTESQRRFLRGSMQKALKKIQNETSKAIMEGASPEMAVAGVSTQVAEIEKTLRELDQSEHLPRLLLQTATLEALPERMAEQGGFIGLWSDEGGFWKKYLNARGDDILLQAYVGNGFAHSTKTAGSCFLENPCLAIISLVQPSILEKLYGMTELEQDGLLPRILPILCPSSIFLPSDFTHEFHSESVSWYKSTIKSLLSIERSSLARHEILLDVEAAKILRNYQENNVLLFFGDTQGLTSFRHKLAGHAARIAGALHLLQHPSSPHTMGMSVATMQAGIDCADLFLEYAKTLLKPDMGKNLKYARKILLHICRRNRPQCTVRELSRWTSMNAESLLRGLDILEQHNIIHRHYGDQGRITCIIHPGVFNSPFSSM